LGLAKGVVKGLYVPYQTELMKEEGGFTSVSFFHTDVQKTVNQFFSKQGCSPDWSM